MANLSFYCLKNRIQGGKITLYTLLFSLLFYYLYTAKIELYLPNEA